ncbi:MAG: low molecular weight phosphatase family protein [Pseudomonadota bacterium]
MSAAVSSVLFACNMNSVRSPMAEALAHHLLPDDVKVDSCGVYRGIKDPFVLASLEEEGVAPPPHDPREFAEVDVENYDLIVALTPEAAAEARKLNTRVEFWEVDNPTDTRGSEAEIRSAYAQLRHQLTEKISERFVR